MKQDKEEDNLIIAAAKIINNKLLKLTLNDIIHSDIN